MFFYILLYYIYIIYIYIYIYVYVVRPPVMIKQDEWFVIGLYKRDKLNKTIDINDYYSIIFELLKNQINVQKYYRDINFYKNEYPIEWFNYNKGLFVNSIK